MPVRRPKGTLPDYRSDLRRLRTYFVPTDIEADYQEVVDWIKTDPTTRNSLCELVRKNADMALKAESLYHLAREEETLFNLEYRKQIMQWRNEAILHWEVQKEHGFHKQITERMIEDFILETHPIAYLTLQARHSELNQIVASLKALSTRVSSRGSDLRKLLDAELRRPEIPNWFDGKEGEK